MDTGEMTIRLSEGSGVPLYRQIARQVEELIRSGSLPPGSQLPSFRRLAPRLRVSGITVRRAYLDLATAGLIAVKQGRGTFVTESAETVVRHRALDDAREHLAWAVARARRLGLEGPELLTALQIVAGPGSR